MEMIKKCKICEIWLEADIDVFYGFILDGEEFEFEDGARCNSCTLKAKEKKKEEITNVQM